MLIFVAMYQLHTGVVVPLRDLVELAHKARRGDLSVRASHVGNDELGVLGHAFNLMAADLSAMYAELEARVEQQTGALRISNRSLELLYHTTRRLGETLPDEAAYRALIEDIETLTGLGSVTLCLVDSATCQAAQVFSTRTSAAAIPSFCHRPNCALCWGDGATHPLDACKDVFSIPIKDQEQQFGVLLVRNSGLEAAVTAWQLPLLETVARHIAATLRAARQAEHRWQLELLEERNALARELHDSLAQSLSYLKIQVSRLHALLSSVETAAEAHEIVTELREGLNSAYRQLRELIATFRLRMEHPRLEENLHAVVQEFSRRGQLPIELDCADWQCALKPNEQIHVMQIIREGLNNAVKHACADHIAIRLSCADRGEAVIEIRDNGVGLSLRHDGENHFGLSIMRERASHLGGTLCLQSPPTGGLWVQLCFIPAAHRQLSSECAEVRHV